MGCTDDWGRDRKEWIRPKNRTCLGCKSGTVIYWRAIEYIGKICVCNNCGAMYLFDENDEIPTKKNY